MPIRFVVVALPWRANHVPLPLRVFSRAVGKSRGLRGDAANTWHCRFYCFRHAFNDARLAEQSRTKIETNRLGIAARPTRRWRPTPPTGTGVNAGWQRSPAQCPLGTSSRANNLCRADVRFGVALDVWALGVGLELLFDERPNLRGPTREFARPRTIARRMGYDVCPASGSGDRTSRRVWWSPLGRINSHTRLLPCWACTFRS